MVEHVSVHHPSGDGTMVQALDDVSLSVGDGELVVGLGASGCGKSTLLNAIAGFVRPSGGRITVDGLGVTGPGADRGVVFQRDTLLPWSNTLDNVAFGLKLAGMGRRERRAQAAELLRSVGLAGFERTPIWQLSGGMRQRVGLARALATDPKMLLMDEPLGALDSLTREVMQELIVELWARTRKRMLFITHSIEEALFLGTQILVFSPRPGRIIGRFSPGFVQQFVAGRPAAEVKADPAFGRMRLDIRELIHLPTGAA